MNGAPGRLLLVPNLLGAGDPHAVLPAGTVEAARKVAYWVVETPKAARAFLKLLLMPRAIAELSIEPIGDSPTGAQARSLLAPTLSGHDVAMLSDAGCPAVADPGAVLVATAHHEKIQVVPLVGPSAIVLGLMAAGMNGQRFAFHGYLPVAPDARTAALRQLEVESRAQRCTQIFIETPYRNVSMIETLLTVLRPGTRLCVACDLTLPTESVVSLPASAWRHRQIGFYAKRPAIFLIQA